MSYNRWMPVQCSSELYHHGVKGMKWGKHLFGKGVDIQAGAGGGGGSNEDDLKLLEELKKKYGDKALEMFKKIKQQQQAEDGRYGTLDKLREKITGKADPDNIKQAHDRVYERTLKGAKATKYSGAKSESDEEYASRSAKETAEKTKEYIKEHSVAGAIGKAKKKLDGVTREKRIPEKKIAEETIREQRIPEKKIAETVIKEKKVGAGDKGKNFYEQNKDKMHYKVGDMDTDARVRRYTAEGRERFRQNGKYRNMNLTDVYGENSKVNGNVGKNGANLYKMMDVDDIHDGKNYSTRDFDTSKHNDGKYGLKDKIREKVTGKADPDHLKQEYNDYVRDFERSANQKQAYSVGMEEEHVRKQAKKAADSEEYMTYDKSLAKIADKITGKKRELSYERPLLSQDATNKGTRTKLQNRRRR